MNTRSLRPVVLVAAVGNGKRDLARFAEARALFENAQPYRLRGFGKDCSAEPFAGEARE